MSKILKIIAREILDSRGYPTVESEVHLQDGVVGIASVPSGASVGSFEALELRDEDPTRFFGKGVIKAVNAVNGPISAALIGKDVCEQCMIDQIMIDLDGTKNKSHFGANAILSVSLAIAKSAAASKNIPLYVYISELYGAPGQYSMPLPMMNIINGGRHANNSIDIQEFMIQPIGAQNIKEAIRIGSEIFHHLGNVLVQNGVESSLGDEGGYAPKINSTVTVLEFMKEATESANYILGKDVTFAIDCASSELFQESSKKYYLQGERQVFLSEEFTDYLKVLVEQYPITSIEDGQSESDWDGFSYQTSVLGNRIQLVGDDLFVTNPDRLRLGIQNSIANAILIKYNQIGSLSETLETIKIAKSAGYATIISHRSGETEDSSIADLSVGTSSGQIKTGSLRCSDRLSKYNRLIRIEEELGNNAPFKGGKELKHWRSYN